jgi:glycosyltransferase involved in cell wall biosynthesis
MRLKVCHKDDLPFLEEYVKSIEGELFTYDNNVGEFPPSDNYLSIRRIHPSLKGKTAFVNTEQLCVQEKLDEYLEFVKHATEVFDFSLDNINLVKKGTHLPYKEHETEALKKLMDVPKVYDVVISGVDSELRRKYVTALRSSGLRVGYINMLGIDRDVRIARGKCLVNVPYADNYCFYDSKEIDRWQYAGMPILSVECKNVPPGVGIIKMETVAKRVLKLIGGTPLPSFKIGLCMIVKNESHIVHEVLESTLALIDTFCIVDTGSTDNTIKIIRDFYEKHGMDGIVHEREWKGFGPSRSEALKLCDGMMDYILMIDADDLMVFPGDGNAKKVMLRILNETAPNACNVHIKRGTLEYERTQIFKASDNWRYVGVLHEYPTNDNPRNLIVKLPNEIHMIGRTMGARTLEPGNKYAKDAETILKALETEPDNERYMFYLAQSYRDAGMPEESIKWYTKRYEIGRWAEERFISALNLTRLLNSKEWAWKAYEISPVRIESLVAYGACARMQRNVTHETLAMLLYASTIEKPKGQTLFLETDAYDWRVWDELSMCALILGKHEITKMACTRLLKSGLLPTEHTDRVKQIFMHAIKPT